MNRREFLKIGGGALLIAGAGLGPILRRRRQLFRQSTVMMGTIAEIQVVHDDERRAFRAIEAAFSELSRMERQFSYYRPDSDVGMLNSQAVFGGVHVQRETENLIRHALHWAAVTEGGFDPALGRVTTLWDVKHRTEPPAPGQWTRWAGRRLYREIRLGADIRFLSKDVQIDLGGIAKGYAADRAIATLREEGIDQGLVNLGGDVATCGGRLAEEAWRIGIQDPARPGAVARVLSLRNQSVATSGTYQLYFRSGDHLYHHLINPTTARPEGDTFRSLTVVGDNCRDADALATGLFYLSQSRNRRILEHHTKDFQVIRLDA